MLVGYLELLIVLMEVPLGTPCHPTEILASPMLFLSRGCFGQVMEGIGIVDDFMTNLCTDLKISGRILSTKTRCLDLTIGFH